MNYPVPKSWSRLCIYSVRFYPASGILDMPWGNEYPSYIGTAWLTPYPQSNTIPFVLPLLYRLNTAY